MPESCITSGNRKDIKISHVYFLSCAIRHLIRIFSRSENFSVKRNTGLFQENPIRKKPLSLWMLLNGLGKKMKNILRFSVSFCMIIIQHFISLSTCLRLLMRTGEKLKGYIK